MAAVESADLGMRSRRTSTCHSLWQAGQRAIAEVSPPANTLPLVTCSRVDPQEQFSRNVYPFTCCGRTRR